MDMTTKKPPATKSILVVHLFSVLLLLASVIGCSKKINVQGAFITCYTVLRSACGIKTCRADLQNDAIEPLVIRVTIPFFVIKGDEVCKVEYELKGNKRYQWEFRVEEQLLF